MELQPGRPTDDPPPPDEFSPIQSSESLAPLRKRQRQNLQDVSNTKPLTPIRASGRIRIKMTAAAAELKPPEPAVTKPAKVVLINNISNKQRRRPKKLKTDLVSELAIDVKRPSSVLVDTSIRALLTNVAFSQLSPENQKILIESLPLVDRPTAPLKENQGVELNLSSINNEFFNRACIEWRDRLSNGEFTNEHQTKLRAEHEREKSKIDPWKARNFEGIWGIKSNGHGVENVGAMMEKSAMEMKGMVEQGDFEIPEGFISEVWKREEISEEDGEDEDIKMELNEENWKLLATPTHSPSENLSISLCIPTPPETVTSTQPELIDLPERPSSNLTNSLDSLASNHQPVIAEATSTADSMNIIESSSPGPSTSMAFLADDDYAGEIASHVELSNEGVPTRWYHQHEHDYLKNMEPEPSGMEEIDGPFEREVNDINEHEIEESFSEHLVEHVQIEDSENEIVHDLNNVTRIINNVPNNSRINSYDTELPQEIFHKPENMVTSFQPNSSNIVLNNYVHHQEPVVVRQVIESGVGRYNAAVIVQEEQNDSTAYESSFMIEEAEIEDTRSYRDEIHMNVPKNVKLLAFPSGGKYNDKFIIEESSQHLQPTQQHIHQQPTNFRTNGTAIQNSYFVGGTNFAYISKMGNKIEPVEPARIIKQEANSSQGQMKQRIIYEIATEPKVTYEQASPHHVTYTAQPQQEIFHQMVKHPNGTTTIYETTAPSSKKTIIQRKKTIDPYTVQVVANNNTIILTPIGSTSQQNVQQQAQKSIVHIHRTAPMMQTNSPPVQFLTAPQTTFLKKQTVIHPQMTQKSQPKYTTVIRTPSVAPSTAPALQPPQIITTVSSKLQRPIQKQKVIMSTSSLQQYRYNQKSSAGHGSRKQLHPQHIIRPAPSTTTTTVIHQMMQEPKQNQIPVILPTNDHVIMSSSMSITANQIPAAQPTVVTIGPPGINNIYVRPKRPQQIFQPTHQHLNNLNNMITSTNIINMNNQQVATVPLRMRHQQNNQRPPPGTINLERSYQICQAVIQNSANPNRQQLNNQLKPPPLNCQKKF